MSLESLDIEHDGSHWYDDNETGVSVKFFVEDGHAELQFVPIGKNHQGNIQLLHNVSMPISFFLHMVKAALKENVI